MLYRDFSMNVKIVFILVIKQPQ